MFIHGGLSYGALTGVAVVEREVGRGIGHWMLARGNVHLDAAEREVLAHLSACGQVAQRVSLALRGQCIKCVAELHVRIERVVLGLHSLLAIAVV